jgi:hypothetical protein
MHLCANMVIDGVIPRGEKIRRSFSFWPGEKSALNRAYRQLVDKKLAKRYRLTDFFFALSQTLQGDRQKRVCELAKTASVELMSHPRATREFEFLMSDNFLEMLKGLKVGGYSAL